MAYAIMRAKKLKRGALAGVGAHLGRLRDTPNADPSKAHLNQHMGTRAADLGKEVDRRLGVIEARTGRKTRRDAVVAVEVLCAASPEWFQEHGGEGSAGALANAATKWAAKEFGKANIISADLHMDETTPHVHLLVFPEVEGKLSAKQMLGNRERLSALQDSYAEALAPLGLERGLKGSKAKHTTIRQYYQAVNDHQAKRQEKALQDERRASIREKRERMAPGGAKPKKGA